MESALWKGSRQGVLSFGGDLDSTGCWEVRVACRGWSAGHVKS